MRIPRANPIRPIGVIDLVGDRADLIGDDHLAAAMALIDWMWGHVRVMLATWGASPTKEIEDRIVTVLRRFGPLKRRELIQKSKNKKVSVENWNAALRALKDATIVVPDPAGVHYLAETIPGM